MSIFGTNAISTIVGTITNTVKDNISFILIFGGFIVGLTVIMSLIDQHNLNKYLDDYGKRWR